MNASISELWNTTRQILLDSNDSPIGTISDLKKCENVLVEKIKDTPFYEVLIDDEIIMVSHPVTVQHPSGAGSLRIIETC